MMSDFKKNPISRWQEKNNIQLFTSKTC